MTIPVLYYSPWWRCLKRNGPWIVRTGIFWWAGNRPQRMTFTWYLPNWRTAWQHWCVSAGFRWED